MRRQWIAAVLLCACAPDVPGDASSTVESPADLHCTTEPQPSLVYGLGSMADTRWFGTVSSGVLLEGGRAAVADPARHRIVILSNRSGDAILTVGRKGGGPGEFVELRTVHGLSGDTLVALDRRSRRLVLLSASTGQVLGSYGIPRETRYRVSIAGVRSDSTVVYAESTGSSVVAGESRDSVRIREYTVTGVPIGAWSSVPGTRRYFDVKESFSMWLVPYSGETAVTVAGSAIVTATGEADAMVVLRPDSTQTRLPFPYVRRPVTGQLRAAFENAVGGEEPSPSTARFLADVQYPDSVPRFGSLHGDRLGHVWVERYSTAQSDSVLLSALDLRGQIRDVVRLPPRSVLLDASPDFLLVKRLTSEDVNYVQLHRRTCR